MRHWRISDNSTLDRRCANFGVQCNLILQFGFAFRQMMDRRVSPRDILEFIKQWDENQQEEVRD